MSLYTSIDPTWAWVVKRNGGVDYFDYSFSYGIRPVINVLKRAITKTN